MPQKAYTERRNCIQRIKNPIMNMLTKHIESMTDGIREELCLDDMENPSHKIRIDEIKKDLRKNIWNSIKKYDVHLQCLDERYGDGSYMVEDGCGIPSSEKANEWICSEESKLGYKLVKEYSIPEYTYYHVDAYDPRTNTCYEYYGDYWHGNPRVFDADKKCSRRKCTFGEIYETTMKRLAHLRSLGYKVCVKWETDFDTMTNTREVTE